MIKFFNKLGQSILNFIEELGQIARLIVEIHLFMYRIFRDRQLILNQMEKIGVNSIPLVIIIATFTGAVTAWQAAYQLKGLAPLSIIGGASVRAIITELGPVLTGIIIAGRVGASIAAELGTMKVTEQIDALETMSINPVRYLAMPRYLGSLIMMPILVIFANFIAMFGAFIVSQVFLDISFDVFFESVRRFFTMKDFFYGMSKATVFGGVTSIIGCYIGLKTEGGAEGVGLSTIRSFVISAASILIFDYVLWMLFF